MHPHRGASLHRIEAHLPALAALGCAVRWDFAWLVSATPRASTSLYLPICCRACSPGQGAFWRSSRSRCCRLQPSHAALLFAALGGGAHPRGSFPCSQGILFKSASQLIAAKRHLQPFDRCCTPFAAADYDERRAPEPEHSSDAQHRRQPRPERRRSRASGESTTHSAAPHCRQWLQPYGMYDSPARCSLGLNGYAAYGRALWCTATHCLPTESFAAHRSASLLTARTEQHTVRLASNRIAQQNIDSIRSDSCNGNRALRPASCPLPPPVG